MANYFEMEFFQKMHQKVDSGITNISIRATLIASRWPDDPYPESNAMLPSGLDQM